MLLHLSIEKHHVLCNYMYDIFALIRDLFRKSYDKVWKIYLFESKGKELYRYWLQKLHLDEKKLKEMCCSDCTSKWSCCKQ